MHTHTQERADQSRIVRDGPRPTSFVSCLSLIRHDFLHVTSIIILIHRSFAVITPLLAKLPLCLLTSLCCTQLYKAQLFKLLILILNKCVNVFALFFCSQVVYCLFLFLSISLACPLWHYESYTSTFIITFPSKSCDTTRHQRSHKKIFKHLKI